MKRAPIALLAGLAVTGHAATARAEDPKADSLTVLPTTKASFLISTKEKRGILGYSTLFESGVRLSLETSAPLDEDTRTAAFLRKGQLASGFRAELHIGYDSTHKLMNLTDAERQLADLHFCEEVNGAPSAAAATAPVAAPATTGPAAAAEPTPPPATPAAGAAPAEPLDRVAVRDAVQEALTASKQTITEAVKAALEKEGAAPAPVLEIPACTTTAVEAWGKAHPDRPEWKRYQAIVNRNRRDLSINVIPADSGPLTAYGLDVSGSFDQASLYESDLAAPPRDVTKYDVQFGPSGTVYLQGSLAFNLRAGVDISRGFSASKVDRCVALPSTDTDVSAKSCASVLFAKNIDEDAKAAGYARLAMVFQPQQTIDAAAPGVEARIAVEDIGQTPILNLRLTGYLSPDAGPVVARFGVGMNLSNVLRDDPANGLERGTLAFTPFIFVGATPDMLDKLAF
ncbi:hypothetical protein WMF11_11935 [Sorangium sp. So ce295]|uniref:hypothetical protein n=1 Tax=Sorangium sp. So ce295 TaxID=3133295 RepID=UPI003F5F76F3